jgi:MFS transporter, OFA family, oxalate/formate antiporter
MIIDLLPFFMGWHAKGRTVSSRMQACLFINKRMTCMAERAQSISPKFVLLASTIIQICLGGLYAWSTFVGPLQQNYGYTAVQTQCIFGATIATFTLAMIPAGRLLPRYGPRCITTIAGVLFALGYLLAAMSKGNYILMLLGIGVIAGAGIGFGYVCPLVTSLAWFPHNRGLVIGFVVAGFGAGAIVLTTASAIAFAHGISVLQWFVCLALSYGIVLLLCAQRLILPLGVHLSTTVKGPRPKFWSDVHFWSLVLGIFCGTFAGLLVIGNLKPIGLSWGMTSGVATGAVSLFALGNAAGRIGWGWLADRWGSKRIIPLMLLVGAAGLAIWPLASWISPIGFLAVILLIAFFFGGCFVLFAAQVSSFYGSAHLPLIYPWVFLAYGLAALAGPIIGGWLYDLLRNYRLATFIASTVCAAGGISFAFMSRSRQASAYAPVREKVA